MLYRPSGRDAINRMRQKHTVMFRVAGVECARSACVKVVEHDSGKPDVQLRFDTIPFYTRI